MPVYGLVIVYNVDGTIQRQFRITADEYHALGQKGTGSPPGVTRAEWEAKRSVMLRGRLHHRPLAIAVLKEE